MSERKPDRVLFLSPQGPHRGQISKSLAMMDYKADFVSNVGEVYSAIDSFGSSVFVHDWAATDATQGRRLHRTWKASYWDVIRCTVHDKIVPSVQAFASEAGIDKVISKGDAIIGLAGVIDILKSEKNKGELTEFLKKVQTGQSEYTQEELDLAIESSYENTQIIKRSN